MRHRIHCLTLQTDTDDRSHDLVVTSRGAIGVLKHTRVEVRRLGFLSEFGHKVCNCLACYFRAVGALRKQPNAVAATALGHQMNKIVEEEQTLKGMGRQYRRWRKRYADEMDRLGKASTGYSYWGKDKPRFPFALAAALSARGHYVTDTLNGSVLNVSLGSRLSAVRVEITIDKRNSKGHEIWGMSVMCGGISGYSMARLLAMYDIGAHPISKEYNEFYLKRAVDTLERAIFEAYMVENHKPWRLRPESRTEKTPASRSREARLLARSKGDMARI